MIIYERWERGIWKGVGVGMLGDVGVNQVKRASEGM
jgi:hypothetical protein